MSRLVSLINTLCAEIRSDKVGTRNKAAEQLETHLSSSKEELLDQLQKRNDDNVSWTTIFNSAIDATIKHAIKVEETKDGKTQQTMRNKNYIYSAIVSKLINYNLEEPEHLFNKDTLFLAFQEGFQSRVAIKYFSDLFLSILHQGLFKSPIYVRELKLNEYSRILSYLFETNSRDDLFRFASLKAITKTMELSHAHVQMSADVIDYFPEVINFAVKAVKDGQKSDVIKMYYLMVSQHSVDYHNIICNGFQDLLPLIGDYYQPNMKAETKELLFKSIHISLQTLYPYIQQGDVNTINIVVSDTWPKALKKLRTIVEVEIKVRRGSQLIRSQQIDTSLGAFVKMAALVIYLVYWHIDGNISNTDEEEPESRAKISKPPDKLEIILNFVQSSKDQYNEIWLSVLSELVTEIDCVVNITNYQQLLNANLDILQNYANAKNIRSIRLALTTILKKEKEFNATKSIPSNYCQEEWLKIVQILITDTSSCSEVIAEKQLILQELISHQKLSTDNCTTLINSFITNAAFRRSECVLTVQYILKIADLIGLDKISAIVGQFITWVYGEEDKNKGILLHIEPITPQLIADTCAIAVINFLDTSMVKTAAPHCNRNCFLQSLQFKYIRKYLCLENHARELKFAQQHVNATNRVALKNCLFQSNYELLMRTLNFETSKGTSCKDIILDLSSLLKMSLLMRSLLQYGVFDESTFMQCPLIKRIGFFLSHLEFQLKNNLPASVNLLTLSEILDLLEKVILCFTSNTTLLQYMETQPIDEMVTFLGASLKICVKSNNEDGDSEFYELPDKCICMLASICASSSHWKDAFEHIFKYKFNLKTQTKFVLQITKIFCSQKLNYEDIGNWIVSKLKTIFKLYHTHVEIMNNIVEMLPAIFVYIQHYEDPLDDMLLAMSSLFKIAFRKSYSSQLTAKIIHSICYIVRDCCDIYVQENFRNLCFSIVNFLPFPSLDIKYAAINTITALMDINWLRNTKCDIELYYEFCDTVYESINWNKLQISVSQAESSDQLQNSMTLNVQLLVALMTFSCYHRDSALQELSRVCALYKFTQADFNELHKIASFYNTTTKGLIKPCIPSAIHVWISKSYPILKFPFYLCYQSKQDFMLDNIDLIVTCLLLYDKFDDLQKLRKFSEQEDLLKSAMPVINAFILSSQCPANESDVSKNYVNNVYKLNLDFGKARSETNTWKITYTLFDMLRDDGRSREFAGFSIYFQSTKWYNINYKCLQSALNLYMNTSNAEPKPEVLLNFVTKYPLRLVKTFGALKKSCSECVHPIESLKQFYKFYTLSEMVMETLNHQNVSHNLRFYFIRDIIFYCLHCMESAVLNDLRKLALTALDKVITKISVLKDIDKFMEKYLHLICKSLVQLCNESMSEEVQQKICSLCKYLIENHMDAINDKQYMVNVFASNEKFINVIRIMDSLSEKSIDSEEFNNWKRPIEIFLENSNCTMDSFKLLKHHISLYKSDLQAESSLLYRLIRHLLQIVRQTQQNNSLNLEALKCLGEIGPLNLKQMSYYFEVENFQNVQIDDDTDHIKRFYESTYITLEKLLETFNASTHSYVIEVAQYLVNCKYGLDLIDSFPYFIVFRTNAIKNYLDTYDSITLIDWTTILKSCESFEYDKFMCQFVSQIYKNCNWMEFHDLAANDVYFAENTIIPLIRLLLQCEQQQKHMDNIITMLEYFFDEFKVHHNSEISMETKLIYKEKRAINLILMICECIRIHNSWKLPLQLLNVAQACNYCQAYFLSIIYLEMWALDENVLGDKTNVEIMSNDQFQEIARKAYDSIGCNDAISGFINPLVSRMDYLNLTNNWSDILIESNNACSDEANNMCNDILKRNGMLSLTSSNTTNKSSMTNYEICWRLCRWDTVVEGHSKVNTLNDMEYEYEKHHFNALKCLYNKEENNALAAIDKSRHCVLNILKEISVECLQSVYKYLTWLQLLQQSEDFSLIQFSKSLTVDGIFKKWQMESDDLEYGVFSSKELILSHKIALFQTAGLRANRKIEEFYKNDPIEKCLLKCIRDCKAAGEINLAKRYISILNNMPITSNPQVKVSALLEDVDICMKTGKPEITKSILNYIFKRKEYQYCLQRVKAMQLNGEYLLETNAETFETVLVKYFKGSLEVLERYNKSKDFILHKYPNLFTLDELKECDEASKKSAFEIIAKYADREYTQLNTYANSDQFKMKCQIMEFNRQTAQQIGRNTKDRDKQVSATFMKKTSHIDEQEIKHIQEKVTANLCIAVENYMKFSALDSAISSPVIYRIICLWFGNKQNEALRATIQGHVIDVPSYKFICALNQMTARLNSKNPEFIKILKEIMVRCVVDHPQQTLYQLYPIVYGYVDGRENKTDYRSKIAQEIIAKAKVNIDANIVKQLEMAIPELIDFANKDLGSNSISLSDKLKRMKNLDAMQCPTIELPVRTDKNYNITSIVKWNSQVSLVGGINAPKKLECLCSDGITRPQLLKGKDDLRQDAVMQQVFSMINDLLKQDPEAVQRKLLIRTYKVVPLSTRSGILEWCLNTLPIGMYLMPAHKKYHPNDYTIHKCRQLASGQQKAEKEKRYQIHVHIMENIKPVFHYFFFEKFLRPGIWFERRLAYINSVATTSMVGFILGLGDRHTQNILIDQKTAEVIHIDFGIAFEQGKIMPTPETVPFRLTRDMIAPMGITGTNGVFKKSCETTMTILRRHQDVITTILEVLLYDPLYIWKVIPQVNDDNANSPNEEKNYIAQRALIAVQNKLEGKQSGIFGSSSVPVQVERIINEAMNIRNLCMLFPGWDPYL